MSYQGKFLVARPVLKDPVFESKVILVTKYDEKTGSEGFILNGPVVGKVGYGETAKEAVPQDQEQVIELVESGKLNSSPLYFGGPCRSPGIYVVHGYPSLLEAEMEKGEFQIGSTLFDDSQEDKVVCPGVYYGTPSTMAYITFQNKQSEAKFRFFNGVAGWSPGQLEREIEAGAWDVIDADPEVVFSAEKAEALANRLCPSQVKEHPKDYLKDAMDDEEPPPFRLPVPSVN